MKYLFAYVFYIILISSAYAADHTSISSDFNRTKAINFLKAQKYNKLYEYNQPYVEIENPDAMNIHGIMYMNDKSRIDTSKAIYWYKKSANKNNFRAMINLGDIYKNGIGIEKDHIKALEFYKKAADLNSTIAMRKIAAMYQVGEGVFKDSIAAYKWYRKAADENDALAMENIGYMYQKGIGVAKSYEQAINWYEKSIKHGRTYGYVDIAYVYNEMGQIFNVIKWLKKGIKHNETSAYIELSLIEKDQKNYKKSFTLMEKAVDANHSYAMMRLSDMYRDGIGIEKNITKAYFLVRKAEKLNDSEAFYQLGNAYYFGYYNEKKDINLAIEYYEKAIKFGNKLAYSSLSGIYLYGDTQNLKKAYDYISKSIYYQHDILSQFRLAQMYTKGLWVSKDIEKAKGILEKVVQTKISKKLGWGLYELGKIYYEQNQTVLSLSYLQKAQKLNSDKAENLLKYINNSKQEIKKTIKNNNIYFEVDPKGHTGVIFDGIKVNEKNQIITASHDKTIRVWDQKTNKVIRKILGEIGTGQIGVINAVALTVDNKYLATGGIFSEDTDKAGSVRIYDFVSGKILFILDGLPGSIKRLKFTSNGKFLIATSGTKIKIWNIKTWEEHAVFSSFTEEIIFFEIVTLENDNIIFASDGKHVISFSINHKIGLNDLSANTKKLYSGIGNQYIYRADENKLEFFDYNLSYIGKKIFDKDISSIHTSPITKYILLSFIDSNNKVSQELYKQTKNELNKIESLDISKNQLFGTRFISKDEVGIANILDNSIKIWNLNDKYLKNILMSQESMHSIVIGYNNHKLSLYNPLTGTKVFDFKELKFANNNNVYPSKYKQLVKNTDKYSIQYLGKANPALEIKNKLTGEVTNLPVGVIFSWGILKDKYLVVGALDEQSYVSNSYMGKILIFTMEGEKIYELHGHKSAVVNFAYDKKKDILFSAGSDGMVKIWDMAKLSNQKQVYEYDYNIVDKMMDLMNQNMDSFDNREEFLAEILGKSDEQNRFIENYIKSSWDRAGLYTLGKREYKLMMRNYLKNVEKIKPLLSLFVSRSNEWVMWTEDGFFDASKNGAKYIGYHINQGFDKEAKFITSDQVYNEFYRPDIVKKALNKEDISRYSREINIDKIVKGGLAPEVKFLTRRTMANKRDIDLNAKVCDTGGGIGDVIVSLNGTNIKIDALNRQLLPKNDKDDGSCYQVDMLVTLQNGTNELKLFAFNEKGTIESDIDSLQIDNKLKQSVKSDLYLLSIAVNKYMDKSLQLKYPVDDAIAIEKAMQNITGTLFENTKIIKLYDNNVSKKSIAKVFESISKEIKPDDVFMMFMAGHGVTDDGKYYFLPYDFKFTGLDSIQKYGVSIDDLKDGLLKIAAQKSLVLLDTCNSGAFTNEIMSRGLEEKMAIARLHRATGRNYIAASSDNQVALEGYEGHGVFTYTVVDALEGKGFNNGKLTVVDLAKYVEDVLPEISYKKWGYMQVPQKSLSGSDFPIGLK